MDWITDQIAIGNVNDALAPDLAVDFILCLKPGCCADRSDFDAVCIPLVDGAGNNQALIRQALSELNQAVADGLKVLVHCHAGRSRSVSVVARYLMESMGITAEEALALIQQKRDIYLSQGIEEILKLMPCYIHVSK
ncbi:MAG: dual specificity protein phosphatase family protein [Desulfuromonadaceae bacterium]|nr:dual specificity protein phosphatase family protein [Desulfuromonadaceae bacterium]